MASLRTRTRGGSLMFEIDFYVGGQRKTIPLGVKYTQKTANELKGIVEILLRCLDNGIATLDKRTETWIETASPEIREKLAKAGLIELPPSHTLKELWDVFLAQKVRSIKESTFTVYEHAQRRFFSFFGTDEELSELTKARMEQWKEYLQQTDLAEATVAGTITKAKAVFNWAVSKDWIEKSPLDGVGRGSFVNRENDRFITMDEYYRLLDACPCQDWRVIIALARIGGLRCPSEVLRLRWTDINWKYPARFYVTSSKTERYVGKEGRMVPLFSELHKELERLFELDSTVGKEFVINRYRDPERTNLGTQFARIVKMAGVEPIQRPFDNMRASRSTEVYAEFGAFYESKWIGHSSKIAKEHYLQVREVDFERAVGVKPSAIAGRNAMENGFPAMSQTLPAFLPAESAGMDLHHLENIPVVNQR